MATTGRTTALEQWLRDSGGYLHPSVKICEGSTTGVHWRASDAIEPGTRVSIVPHTLALSYLNALVDDAYPVFKQRRADFKVEAMDFFYLMVQHVNKETSFWRPYLDTLPSPEEGFSTPLWFDEPDDLRWLEGTDVLHTMLGRREVYEQYYHSGLHVLHRAGVDVQPYTWDLFRWAVTMFTSRSFSSRAIAPHGSKYWTAYKMATDGRRQTVLLDLSHAPAEDLDFPVLFPVQDAPNHSLDARVDWAYDPGRFSVSLNDAVEAGQEVFNNYGPKSNDELLLGYGFCIPDNPNDKVLLTLKAPPEGLQSQLQRIHPGYFTSGQWSGERATFGLRKPAESSEPGRIFHSLPEPLLELLLYILRHDRGLPFIFYETSVEYLTGNIEGQRYLPHVAKMIVQSLAPKLAKLQETTLPDQPVNYKQQQAKTYRDSQVAVLQSTISVLRSFTRSLLRPPAAPGPRFVTLEGLLELWSARCSPEAVRPFIAGLEACSGTADVDQLRQAGWEEDVLALLLCYIYLDATNPSAMSLDVIAEEDTEPALKRLRGMAAEDVHWVSTMVPDYVSSNLQSGSVDDGPAAEHSQSILELVGTATQLQHPATWADERWTAHLVAAFGLMLQYESMMMMVPRMASGGKEEPRLVVYIHGNGR